MIYLSILDRKHILTINLDNSSIEFSEKIKFYNTDKNISNLYVKVRKKDEDDVDVDLGESDLTGLTLKLTVVKPKTKQTRDMTGVLTKELADYTCAIYKFDLPSEFTDQVGMVFGEFELTDGLENGESVTIDPFSYEIKASKLTGLNAEIIANPDLPVLKALLQEVKETVQAVNNIDNVNVSDTKTYSSLEIEKKFTGVNAQFNTMGNETRSKRIQGENTKDDTKGPFDSANFAGQDLGVNAPIGNVMHHYTDGITFQVDNVGENNKILVLKNAYNPSRRPDKAADFVGSGDFLTCLQGVIGDLSKKLFTIGKDGNLYWFDKDDTVILGSNKEDDNTPLAKIIAYKPHKYIFQLVNDNSGLELSIGHIENKVQIESGNYATKGMKLKANLGVLDLDSEGDLNLNPKTKRINIHGVPYIYEGTNYNRCVTIRIGASAGRPTSELYAGMMYLDTSLGSNGKPIWYNGTNWVDANGVVV